MINILTIISFLFAHKFYVSVSYIEYDNERKAIEVQKKFFFDDLEFVIKEKHNLSSFDILKSEKDSVDKYIESYLYENILFDIDGIKRKINYLGHEHLNGTINCYFEVLEVDKFENLLIKDTSLFSAFDSQENLIYLEMDNNLYTIRLKYPKTSEEIRLKH
ncbi:MAG: DUF6702 family protein [Cytophagales bacterium]|nr:MAG: hypothetical protein CND58_03490 [Rhodothermaeota bacterium MED-G16]